MKICYDKIEGMYLSKRGTFRKNGTSYTEAASCSCCGEPYLAQSGKNEVFCSTSCSNSYRDINENTRRKMSINNGNNKGNVTKLGLPLFNTFAERLSPAEKTRCEQDSNDRKLLKVKCSKCGKWYVPSIDAVKRRYYSLIGSKAGENRLYCSDECKDKCEVFGKRAVDYLCLRPDDYEFYTDRELKIWSKEVLKRADYRCEICGGVAEHSHHIQPKKLEPGLALDPYNGVAVCKICHYKYGHSGECSSFGLTLRKC